MITVRAIAHLVVVLLGLIMAADARGHDLGAMKVTASFRADQTYTIDVVVDVEHVPRTLSPAAAATTELRTAKIDELRAKVLAMAVLEFGQTRVRPTRAVASTPARANQIAMRWQGPIPDGVATFTWRHDLPLGDYLLSLQNEGDEEAVTEWLVNGKTSQPFALAAPRAPASRAELMKHYFVLGSTHLVSSGIDHTLFVLGLLFLSLGWRPLLAQLLAFTLAHAIALGLTLCGIVSLPARIVEPLIALSIVTIAVENLLVHRFTAWRVAMVFGFGLLFGVRLARLLRDAGLPSSRMPTALLSFHAGIDVGQLAVIAAAFLIVGVWSRTKPWYRARVILPCSLAMALIGLYWTAQRMVIG